MQADKGEDGVMDGRHSDKRHGAVGREESDRRLLRWLLLTKESSECRVESSIWDIGDVKHLRRRIDILCGPDGTVLEAMDRRTSVIFG